MADIKLTKEQQQMLIAAVLTVGAFGFIYYKYFWAPITHRISETRAKLDEDEKKIAVAEATAARLPQLRKQLADLEVQAQQAEESLPKKKEVPRLIETLSDLAREQHVDIISISPSGGARRENYQENYYNLQIQGSYHSVARFLTALGMEERLLHSRNVVLSPLAASSHPEYSVSAQFTLVVFQYKG